MRAFVRGEAARLGLDPTALRVEYLLNPGGFVNASFRVGDGRRRFHLKLSDTVEGQDGLRRWHAAGEVLARGYHAPRVLEWVELGGARGLLLEHVDGTPPSLGRALLSEIVAMTRRLNRDPDLRALLPAGAGFTAADNYHRVLHDRFTADLAAIEAAPPPLLGPSVLDWMKGEVATLSRLVTASASFRTELDGPVHGDLWRSNVLVDEAGRWHVVDWDDLWLGDPALDLATLTGPSELDLSPLKLRDSVTEALTPDERERLPLLGRATLLDWVVDPLADWIEAEASPEHVASVRVEKERLHREALRLYRSLY